MFFRRTKKEYRYYRNGALMAFATKGTCDICGKKTDCCTDGPFEGGIHSVCSKCFGRGLARTYVPVQVALQVCGPDANEKIEELHCTPPVWWAGENQWPCCCNDFMTYEGIWQTFTIRSDQYQDTYEDFCRLVQEDPDNPVADLPQVYLDLPFIYVNHIFSCPYCGRHTMILKLDPDEEQVRFYMENRDRLRREIYPDRRVPENP